MWSLSTEGQKTIENLAQRHGVSADAARTMLFALVQGNGRMAQFDHPEFGGMGQWTQGGMTMVGDMFNNALKAKVDGLCSELAGLLASEPVLMRGGSHQSQSQSQGGRNNYGEVSLFVSSSGGPVGDWWPTGLGAPSSTGAQNDIRYAYFPSTQRLAIEIHGRVTLYDTEDHHISGVSQQQSGDASLTFTSQRGLVRVADLRVVSPPGDETPSTTPRAAAAKTRAETKADTTAAEPPRPVSVPEAPAQIAEAAVKDVTPVTAEPPPPMPASPSPPQETASGDDIFTKIERLADLHKKGVLSADEYSAKKAELLSRL